MEATQGACCNRTVLSGSNSWLHERQHLPRGTGEGADVLDVIAISATIFLVCIQRKDTGRAGHESEPHPDVAPTSEDLKRGAFGRQADHVAPPAKSLAVT